MNQKYLDMYKICINIYNLFLLFYLKKLIYIYINED
jgi:hypothetical protein